MRFRTRLGGWADLGLLVFGTTLQVLLMQAVLYGLAALVVMAVFHL